ncbi:uncharacterized protein KY384_002346 [Bacidia gigantensis]|uniref:uncharacterized protein n=1 Tax=Bacidia gigantensis TaxID=2732470 RepID=UPI001D0552EA|nr:uncharacterized protein KY384_002346 [Bacidia gigantensis]KAG8532469.1 hypothetical protein KY384_002346 [Bacidia gigantensis]
MAQSDEELGRATRLEALALGLVSSSPKRRLPKLAELSDLFDNTPQGLNESILPLLFRTYAYYQDRASRRAVQRILQNDRFYLPHTSSLVDFYTSECAKQGLASSNALVLVEWGSVILQHSAADKDKFPEYGPSIVAAIAQALEICHRPSGKARKNLKYSSRRLIERAILKIVDSRRGRPIEWLVGSLTAKGHGLGPRASPFLGALADACAWPHSRRGEFKEQMLPIFDFYTREILGSRSQIPLHIVVGLQPFFSFFVDTTDLRQSIVPALEKALLRAPEVILSNVFSSLVEALPSSQDLGPILHDHLLKPITMNIKSQNEIIRNGAVSAYKVIAGHTFADDAIQKISKQLLEMLSVTKAPVERQCLSQMLESTPSMSSQVSSTCIAMCKIISKETSEAVLGAEIKALFVNVRKGSLDDSILSTVNDVASKGAKDKKLSVRRLWILAFGDFLWDAYDSREREMASNVKLIQNLSSVLHNAYEEASQNPLSAAQNGSLVAAYIFTALWPKLKSNQPPTNGVSKAKSPVSAAMDSEILSSFLLNPKYFSKVDPMDISWLVRALAACSETIPKVPTATSTAWGETYIYTILCTNIPPQIRRTAIKSLKNVYLAHRATVSGSIIQALWKWRKDGLVDKKDTPATLPKADHEKLILVLQCICPPREVLSSNSLGAEQSTVTQWQLVQLLVLCRPEIIPRAHWIEICLRMGEDPGEIAKTKSLDCLERIDTILGSNQTANAALPVQGAALRAAAELAFVAPDIITPLLIDRIRDNLPGDDISKFGPTEIAIARTPEGTAFVDVLSSQTQRNSVHKSSPDYEIAKWEEEMRSQIAQKKGQTKKLTSDEKAKVEAQLQKESAIRQDVQVVGNKLKLGAGLIHALATGPPTDALLWLGSSLSLLIQVIRGGAGRLAGSVLDDAYLACADLVTIRLGMQRKFIGIATLRSEGSSSLSNELVEEPLRELVTRLLHRIHFLGGQRNFDSLSLMYLLPLVFAVLNKGGLGDCDADEADEQITLALEFLEFHTNEFAETTLPRQEALDTLITSIKRFGQHHRLIKDCINGICEAVTSNITESETDTLLKGLITPEHNVRTALLQAIKDHVDLTDLEFCEQIWIIAHDDVEENAALGQAIWQENALEVEPTNAAQVMPYLESIERTIRSAASRALAECVQVDRESFTKAIHDLEEQYRQLAKPRMPEKDAYGMPKKMDLSDPWQARSGIALAFKEMAPAFETSELVGFVDFMVNDGPLGDRNTTVRDEMVESATTVITLHGAAELEALMQKFELALEASKSNSGVSDLVSEAVVILYGAIARHLPEGDERAHEVVQKLLQTLATPSESVQYAVAGCLPPLIRKCGRKTSEFVQTTLDTLLQSKKYAARRGAAYGIAGIVAGKGVSALKEYRILSALKTATENKKDQNQRQGALFAYELLALLLGDTFEPYIIQIVPQLLGSFGDANADVREACLDASKTCFSHLSSYGVKVILPTLLEGLEENQWRSKKGACDLLGAMAYLDPQQLAVSLPDIIPPLTGVLNDSHKEVRLAANRSLQRFGDVISNPEVKSLVSILLKALSDPTKYTEDALEALIKVSFVHYLDSPSLALIVRILQRGLNDRSATKRKSAQIIGSLAHMTERKDVIFHLPILVAGLRSAVIDPVPATRATASKALGSLVEKLGEDALPDLIPSLMTTLKSDTGASDRLGSAQALSEVLAGLGTSRLEETLPTILQNISSVKATVREGFMTLFIYLPACFGNSFANYLSKVIPPILSGLADELETIRETALRAGRLLVKNFASRSIDLLLPELDRGLADINYRIRLSSVELVGDLLFNLTGISGKTEQDENEVEGAAEAGQSLIEVLGEEKRNKILSSLYICRCDTSSLVRGAAIDVWKALVATPRTLKELVPTLTQLIIRRLASSNMEQKVIAGNALGELIRKAGEGVLSSLLPTLEEGLQTSTDTDHRQGICMALREVTSAASSEALEDYQKVLISVVRTALVDNDSEVRESAAEAFDSLQQVLGKKAVDQVLPHLLNLLRSEDGADTALSALLTLLTDNTRSNIILPNLVPTLLVSPISTFNARAVASLAQVAGSSMNRRLPNILNTLMDNIIVCKDEDQRQTLEESFESILLSVDEYDGLNTMMSVVLTLVKDSDHRKRASIDSRLGNFFAKATVDFSRYYQDLIRVLLISFDDSDKEVVRAAWTALSGLTSRLKKEEMESLVLSTRQVLLQIGVAGANLPGFLLPKGINAILPIFLQGLMNGTSDQKVNAALAISDMVDRTSVDSLKPSVTQITGPLIRVVSERSIDVKAAILLTLNNLLEKISILLKPFLPQLQRTFAKCLADPSSELLRSRAAKALGTLITLTPRVDPLIAELVTGSKTADSGVQNAMMKALFEVVSKAGGNMSEASRTSILGLIDSDIGGDNDTTAITHARLFGALIRSFPAGSSPSSLLKTRALAQHLTPSTVLNLNAVLVHSPESLTEGFSQETPSIITAGMQHRNLFIVDNCILASGKYLLTPSSNRNKASESIIPALTNLISPGGPIDTRRLALVVIRTVSRADPELISPHLPVLTPPVFASVRDTVIPVKLAAEAAFLSIFSVEENEGEVFEAYMAEHGGSVGAGPKRSMQDYFKRVAMRLGTQARERREAEGGQGGLGLSNDEVEDEREIWSVGKMELEDKTFSVD